MKLYLVRHATAHDVAASDDVRPLTMHGEQEARIVGEALVYLQAVPVHIFASPLVRAQQTAQIAAVAMGFTKLVETMDELRNDADTEELLRFLKRHGVSGDTMLVGHMPSIGDHLANLVGADCPGAHAFGKACVACVELEDLRAGCGSLLWFKGQKQLLAVAK